MKKNSAVKIAEWGCLLALAMAVSYIEALLPIHLGIPGAKLGLANCVIVLCLYGYGKATATIINLTRVVLCSLLFGNLYSMQYALAGAIFSLIIMILCSGIKVFGMVGISILGGVSHNLGQLTVAMIVTGVPVILYYIPFLIVIGALTGWINGGLASLIYKRVPYFRPMDKEAEHKKKE